MLERTRVAIVRSQRKPTWARSENLVMNTEIPHELATLESGGRAKTRLFRVLHRGENWLVTAALAAMVLLPLSEAVFRLLLKLGITWSVPGASSITKHLTLVVAMIGGMIAAREARLLSLSTLTAFLRGNGRTVARVFSHAAAVAVTGYLCVASWQNLRVEMEFPKDLVGNIPVWWVEAIMPVGFAVVAMRLVWHAADAWRGRWMTLVLGAVVMGLLRWLPVEPEQMRWPSMIVLLVATVFGMPVFATLGGAALILWWSDTEPISAVSISQYTLTTDQFLPTLPLFTLAGYFLAEGGASRRLVRVFGALVGSLRGGPAIVTALVCAFFTSFTGASGVTILALGGLLMPVLVAARYSDRHSLGLLTGAGSLGLLFPPCLPLILYAIIASGQRIPGVTVSIEQMFLGGIVPGFIMVGLTVAWGIWVGPGTRTAGQKFDAREAWRAVWEAKWELLVPVVALGAMFTGVATIVEAAAITALYAFVVETFVCRDLRMRKDFVRVVTECALLIGGVLLILGVALGLTKFLVDAEVPSMAVEWAQQTIHHRWQFLLLLNVFLLVVGCLMDVYSAIVVVVPLIVPMCEPFGIDPVHLGIIFLANLELGFLTPPVGMNLFLSSYRFNKPMPEVIRATLPMLAVLIIGVILVTYIPSLTTALPSLFQSSVP
jgi:tripartite ATP-independent transporter DctM subunit